MKILSISIALLSLAKMALSENVPVLTQELMEKSSDAAILSALAYKSVDGTFRFGNNVTYDDIPSSGFRNVQYFTEEPNQAVLAEKNGRCFAVFRGTTMTIEDWATNLNPFYANVTKKDTDEQCEAREGFVEGYYTGYREELEQGLMDCASNCDNPDDCVVLSGHSQGGAVATIASIVLSDLQPIVITFGEPPSIVAPCDLVPAERIYRYVNSLADEDEGELLYDMVPFLPPLDASFYGYMILVSYDSSGVAYLGFNEDFDFVPDPIQLSVAAHSIYEEPYGYVQRVDDLINEAIFPVPTNGFGDGILCGTDEMCRSGDCYETLVSMECIGDDAFTSGATNETAAPTNSTDDEPFDRSSATSRPSILFSVNVVIWSIAAYYFAMIQ